MTLEAVFSEAVRRHQAGELTQAEAGYRQVLAADPAHAHARHYLGLISFSRGDLEAAECDIAAAIRQLPEQPEFHVNYGNVRKRQGDLAGAEKAYRQALALRPMLHQASYSLGLVLVARGDDTAAGEVFLALTRAVPDFAEAHTALAQICLRQGDAASAEKAYANGARFASQGIEPLLAYGHFLCDRRRAREALPWLRQAVTKAPESARALAQLGVALDGLGRYTDGERACRQARTLIERGFDRQDEAAVWGNLGNTLRNQGRTEEAVDACRRGLSKDGASADMHSNFLFQSLMRPQTPEELFALHKDYAQRWSCADVSPDARPDERRVQSKRRIGFVSADLRRHPVGYFMRGLLTQLDRDKYEVTCYDNGWNADAVTAAIRAHVDHWHSCRELDDDALSTRIRDDQIDMLIDLGGHTADNRLPAFSRRPAPRQLTYLGYPCTTGMDCIDFRITDAVCDPPGISEAWHSERLLRLPDSYYCYSAPEAAPEVTPLPALRQRGLTFGAFLQLSKLSAETLALWARVLTAVPDARLQLHSASFGDKPTERRVMAAFAARGIAAKRITLVGWQPYPAHFSGYASIDIALDTLPFNLATNTCEALWMGVPTLTLCGNNSPGRMGASLLRAAGLPAFITTDPDAFVETALAWNLRRDELSLLRRDLRTQVSASALMDAARFAQNFSVLLESAWASQSSTPAASI
jgi:predicted O-linked N-acetylglucosamine transferase (SPINDLY family)